VQSPRIHGREVKIPEQISATKTKYGGETMKKQTKNPKEERTIKIFQVPSPEDRTKISGKIVLGADKDATGPQCPGSQCVSLCCRC